MVDMVDTVARWPIARVTPYERNARVHSGKQVRTIEASIRKFGFVQPILVDGEGVIIAGHGRYAAAKRAGLAEVPVIQITHLSPDRVRALRVADNKIHDMSDFDAELLMDEVRALTACDVDLGDLGFLDREINKLLSPKPNKTGRKPKTATETPPASAQGAPEPNDDDDGEVVEATPAAPVTCAGDLWLLGESRLICGDATDPATVARVMAGAAPAVMVTDPPYGVKYQPNWRAGKVSGTPGMENSHPDRIPVTNDHRTDWTAAYLQFPGSVAYVWHAGLSGARVLAHLEGADFEARAQIIWRKHNHVIGRGHYHWQHEACWYAVRRGSDANWQGDRDQATVWDIQHRRSGTGHGAQKPVAAMQRPVRNHTRPGDWVYDPFVGSGTTLVAAEEIGRRCVAVEIAPQFVDIAVRRWQETFGRAATLDGDGRSFAEIEAERAA